MRDKRYSMGSLLLWATEYLTNSGFRLNDLAHNDPIRIVESKGYRENEDGEWYAAAIIRCYRLQGNVAEGYRLFKKAQTFGNPYRKSRIKGGKARQAEQRAFHENRNQDIRKEAAKLKNPSKYGKAIRLHEKGMFTDISIERLRKII